MKESEFSNLLLDVGYLYAKGKLRFKRPSKYKGWVKRVVGNTTMWIDIRTA